MTDIVQSHYNATPAERLEHMPYECACGSQYATHAELAQHIDSPDARGDDRIFRFERWMDCHQEWAQLPAGAPVPGACPDCGQTGLQAVFYLAEFHNDPAGYRVTPDGAGTAVAPLAFFCPHCLHGLSIGQAAFRPGDRVVMWWVPESARREVIPNFELVQ